MKRVIIFLKSGCVQNTIIDSEDIEVYIADGDLDSFEEPLAVIDNEDYFLSKAITEVSGIIADQTENEFKRLEKLNEKSNSTLGRNENSGSSG